MNRSVTSASACTPRPSRSSIRNSKPAGGAQALDRRRREDQGQGIGDLGGELLLEAGDQGAGTQLWLLRSSQWLENDIDGAVVGLVDLGDRVVAVEPDRVGHAL